MFSFPASCPGERAVIVLFAHRDGFSGGWAECDFNQAYFYLCVINMHGRGNWRKGGERNELGENEWIKLEREAGYELWNCDAVVHDMCAGWMLYGFMWRKKY